MTQMHRPRAQVFGSRLGWDVEITADEERDEYDRLGPIYILEIDATDRVAGCVRLLPAIGPTMLRQTFPQLLREGRREVPPGMIESSRFCVDTYLEAGRGGGQLHQARLTMFGGIIEWWTASG
ncbi:acyl-homoserine-lactone synthase [Sinorhizobium medicae]|uniref:acyl-homoserine-lactone synthase n=1 Tax=Sinorhizobium medicae TaxID=110321 RepID=UPI002E136502|nr:acyl-homoserine-lactone synthase [Sinorhizobium medicae]